MILFDNKIGTKYKKRLFDCDGNKLRRCEYTEQQICFSLYKIGFMSDKVRYPIGIYCAGALTLLFSLFFATHERRN